MERRNDSTWLLVGVGVGCGFVFLTMFCLGTGALYYCSNDTPGTPPPPTYDPLPPPTTFAPPSTLLPPPTLLPPLPPPPSTGAVDDTAPRTVSATITSVTGSPGVSAGQTCEFTVDRRDRDDGSGFWCNAQVVCGGRLLYGGPAAGFFPCTLFEAPSRGVVGADPNTTQQDRDAAMSLDTVQSTLEIWDDATGPLGEFRVSAHVDGVQ